jgi:hypothetical protein
VTRDHVAIPGEFLSALTASGRSRGLRGEYFDNNRLDGQPRLTRTDDRVDFGWTLNSPGRGIPYDWYSVSWTGTLTIPPGGVAHIGVEGNDGYRLYIDDKLIVDNWRKQSFGTHMAANIFLTGVAYQGGLIPLSAEAIEEAIVLNGVGADKNRQAFLWGRKYYADAAWVEQQLKPKSVEAAKFDRVAEAAAHFPRARRRVAVDLARSGLPVQRAAAVAVRLH